MKKFRKLIPALCMLLVSALFVGTSTYAWFSMNSSVQATNMMVKAKSNARYLLIGDDETNAKATAKTDKAGQPLTNAHDALYATTGNDSKTCYPTAYYTAVGTLNGQATKANTWYTTTSDTHNKAVSGNAEIKEVTEADKDYMLTYKMYLTLTNDSESYTGKLTVTPTITNTSESVKAMVVINGEKNIVDTNNTAFTTKGDVNLTSDNALEVTVYVYNDGNADNVNSTYFNGDATRLNGTVGLSFALETTNN